MKRAALYCRVSTLEQAEAGYSVGEQEARLRAYAEAQGWAVAGLYVDAGHSGATTDRPGLQAMLAALGGVDVVVVTRLDRLSRSQRDTLDLIKGTFLPAGVDFASVSETLDTSTPFGMAMLGILAVFAELEREQIRERMTTGKVGRVKAGKTSAWSRPPFGYLYEEGNLVVDPLRAPIVRWIVDEYLDGASMSSILNRLNAQGHVGKPMPWHHKTVREVLVKPVYAGLTPFKGALYEGTHEPLVPRERWDAVQAEIVRRQDEAFVPGAARPFQSEHLLSGLLHCGDCGRYMMLFRSERTPQGRVKRYKCSGQLSTRHGRHVERTSCTLPHVRLVDLEEAVLAEIEDLRVNAGRWRAVAGDRDVVGERQALEAELGTLAGRLERLADLYVDGGLTREALDRRRGEIEAARAGVLGKLAALDDGRPALDVEAARAALADGLGDVRTWEPQRQHHLVRLLVERIEVGRGDLTIRWRFT